MRNKAGMRKAAALLCAMLCMAALCGCTKQISLSTLKRTLKPLMTEAERSTMDDRIVFDEEETSFFLPCTPAYCGEGCWFSVDGSLDKGMVPYVDLVLSGTKGNKLTDPDAVKACLDNKYGKDDPAECVTKQGAEMARVIGRMLGHTPNAAEIAALFKGQPLSVSGWTVTGEVRYDDAVIQARQGSSRAR